MKRRRPEHLAPSFAENAAVSTGEHCPDTGWWYPAPSEVATVLTADTSGARFIGEGSVMPAVGGKPVLWLRGQERSAVKMFEMLAR
jgi:hypothetical protein